MSTQPSPPTAALQTAALRFLRRFGLVAAAWSALLAATAPSVESPTVLAVGIGLVVLWAIVSQFVAPPRLWFAGWFVVAVGVELLGPLAGTPGRSVAGGISFLVLAAAALTTRRRDIAGVAALLTVVALGRGVLRPGWSVTGSIGTVLLFVFGSVALWWLVRAVTTAAVERDRLLARAVEAEREAAVAHERAEAAARLHDSVLQTLTAIGRAGTADESARLATRAGAELRDFLRLAGQDPHGTLQRTVRAEVTRAADGTAVGVSAVGDAELDAAGAALVAAVGEAVRNAVRHGRPPVRVLLECVDGVATAWVSDRGEGFAPEAVGQDRLGVRNSIVARLEGVEGEATLSCGQDGCEWQLRVPATTT